MAAVYAFRSRLGRPAGTGSPVGLQWTVIEVGRMCRCSRLTQPMCLPWTNRWSPHACRPQPTRRCSGQRQRPACRGRAGRQSRARIPSRSTRQRRHDLSPDRCGGCRFGVNARCHALSRRDFAPLRPPAHPSARQDLGGYQPRALMYGGPASASPRPRLHLPQFAVGADEHIPTVPLSGMTIPPMPLDPHCVTVAHHACAGNAWRSWVWGQRLSDPVGFSGSWPVAPPS